MKTHAALVEGIQAQMDALVLLVRRNYEARSDEHHHARRTIAREIAGDANEITARFEMLSVSEKDERKLKHDIDAAIIQSLAYSSMTERYENITEAFPRTFDWIFEPSTGMQPKWSNFSEWLKTGSGIYWIAGKAGSGKSTLMRYIYEDERTRDYLKSWAKSSGNSSRETPLCVATFFFWLSGTPMQKSELGLLRALLHQVLSSCPQMGSVAFPDIWSKNYSDAIDGLSSDWINALPLKRLRSALQRVAEQTKIPLKIFFLVDGLDEFAGDHEELATLFKVISRSSTIKICVSSRPWIIFEQIYGLRPSLRLQDLTEGDIAFYVNSKFDGSSPFQRLRSLQPELADLLRDEVIEKAEGVFLWVQIVVDSLLTGIRNEDDMAILRQRLTAMPPKLEDLYRHLMSLIDPVYQIWASKVFQIVRAGRALGVEETIGPGARAEGSTPLRLCTLFFAMSENLRIITKHPQNIHVLEVLTPTVSVELSETDLLSARCKITKTRLTVRCAGLLEVPTYDRIGSDAPIQFLHRTARDFIYNDATWKEILDKTKSSKFNANRAGFNGLVLEIAFDSSSGAPSTKQLCRKTANAMLFAHQLQKEMEFTPDDSHTVDTMDLIMTNKSSRKRRRASKKHWTSGIIGDSLRIEDDISYLAYCALYGLSDYINEQLGTLPQQDSANAASKFLHIILPAENWPAGVYFPHPQPYMVSTLFRHGADPNHTRGKPPFVRGPWSNLLERLSQSNKDERVMCASISGYVLIMKLFVEAGAASTIGEYTAHSVAREKLLPYFEKEATELLERIEDRIEREENEEFDQIEEEIIMERQEASEPERKKQRVDRM